MTDSLERWRALLRQLEIKYLTIEELRPLTEEELQALERQAGITLPDGYKEFCQVFGPGAFEVGPYGISIDCLFPINEQGQPYSRHEIIDWTIIDAYKLGAESIELLELLDHAYILGMGQTAIFIFDLRSYARLIEAATSTQ